MRPEIQANTWPMQFLKSQCHHKKQEGGCKEIQVQLTKDRFELMMSEQESPLMNKEGWKVPKCEIFDLLGFFFFF